MMFRFHRVKSQSSCKKWVFTGARRLKITFAENNQVTNNRIRPIMRNIYGTYMAEVHILNLVLCYAANWLYIAEKGRRFTQGVLLDHRIKSENLISLSIFPWHIGVS